MDDDVVYGNNKLYVSHVDKFTVFLNLYLFDSQICEKPNI